MARLHTVRRGVEIGDDAGRRLAVVTDDEVSVMDGRRVASRFGSWRSSSTRRPRTTSRRS